MNDMAVRMSRLGTESAFEVLARAKALEDEGRDIINLLIDLAKFGVRVAPACQGDNRRMSQVSITQSRCDV